MIEFQESNLANRYTAMIVNASGEWKAGSVIDYYEKGRFAFAGNEFRYLSSQDLREIADKLDELNEVER